MKNSFKFSLSVFSGAVAGVVVLGLVGHFAMIIVSFLFGSDKNFSATGFFHILVLGLVVGICGGIINFVIAKFWNFNKFIHSFSVGVILFSLSLLFAVFFVKMKLVLTNTQIITLSIVFIIYLVYGYTVDFLIDYWKIRKNC